MAVHFSCALIVAFILSASVCEAFLQKLIFAQLSMDEMELHETASKISCRVYKGSSIEGVKKLIFPVNETTAIYNAIDHTKPTVLYIHGYIESPLSISVLTIVEAYLQRGKENIIVVDWSALAFESYITVAVRTRAIGTILARTFDDLVRRGIKLETFHLIGHSLGAHIAGFMGEYSNNTITRITGLDPAKPGFYHPGAKHLNATSAKFVDVIHTDGGFYGTTEPTGSVDFYANGGTRPQPGCPASGVPFSPAEFCSHWRSWAYYAESLAIRDAFSALQCDSYENFKGKKCESNSRLYFGYSTPMNARGRYYFDTSKSPPFSKVLYPN